MQEGRGWEYNDNHYMQNIVVSKIIKTGTSCCIVIPKNILRALNLERGDQVIFGIAADDVLMIKKVTADDKTKWKI